MNKVLLPIFSFFLINGIIGQTFEVGGEGANYTATFKSVEKMFQTGSEFESKEKDSKIDFNLRVIESEADRLYHQIEILDAIKDGIEFKESVVYKTFIGDNIYFQTDDKGGDVTVWGHDQDSFDMTRHVWDDVALQLTWMFNEIPPYQDKKVGEKFTHKINLSYKMPIEMNFTFLGELDTLNHQCVKLENRFDLADTYANNPAIKPMLEMGMSIEGEVPTRKITYYDKSNGRLIYSKMNSSGNMKLTMMGQTMEVKTSSDAEVAINPSIKVAGKQQSVKDKIPPFLQEMKKEEKDSKTYKFRNEFEVIENFTIDERNKSFYNDTTFVNGFITFKKGDSWCLMDENGKFYDHMQSLAPVVKVGDYFTYADKNPLLNGLKTLDGTVVLEPKYSQISELKDGYSIVSKVNLFGVIDKDLKEVIPCKNEEFYDLEAKGDFIKISGPSGQKFIPVDESKTIPASLNIIKVIENAGLLILEGEEKFFYNFDFERVLDQPIKGIGEIKGSKFFKVMLKEKKELIYDSSNPGSPPIAKVDYLKNWYKSIYFPYRKDDGWGIMDKDFKVILFDTAYTNPYCKGEICVFSAKDQQSSYLFRGTSDLVKLPKGSCNIEEHSIKIEDGGNPTKWFNFKGEPLFKDLDLLVLKETDHPEIYITTDGEGHFDGLKGLVHSKKGTILKPTMKYFDAMNGFINGYFSAEDSTENCFVSTNGKVIKGMVPENSSNKNQFVNDLFIIEDNEKQGLKHINGEIWMPPVFDELSIDINGFIWVKRGEKIALLRYLK